MRTVLAAAIAAVLAACGSGPLGPSDLYTSYFLSSINGRPLPAPDDDLPDGAVVLTASLGFPPGNRPRDNGPAMVTYARVIRLPDQGVEHSAVQLKYRVTAGELRIDLCPPPALCLVPTELVGRAQRDVLVLTHYLAGMPRSVYRFVAAYPD